jgi:predicted oxidoreductase
MTPATTRIHRYSLLIFCLLPWLAACEQRQARTPNDADVIVVGAGLAGLSAAVEIGRRGIDVLVVDMNSVAGGHTVLAGGVALVGTPVQEQAGIQDSAELAYQDWMAWTVDGDSHWTRFYAENSREMIYDWVSEMGVEFVRVVPSHGNSVPRFHFTEGRAVHLVLPIYRTTLAMPNVSFLWNTRAENLLLEDGRVSGVVVKNLRDGETHSLHATNVVLATGGFESDLDRVLENWIPDLPRPDPLLIGAAISANGAGYDMAGAAGAALMRVNRHFIYVNGLPDPRDADGKHALTAGNDHSMWVNTDGERFTNEAGYERDILVDLLNQKPTTYWMIFDETGRDAFGVRGAAWLNNNMEGHPILDNPRTAKRAQNLEQLAALTGLPAENLTRSVQRYNAIIGVGEDADFGRFSENDDPPVRITQPPYYAVQMYPVTRKNMGGVAIDHQARALNEGGQVIPGLYAVGELNGSVGINGKYGLDGMFLGPAILTGRIAGQSIVAGYPDRTEKPAIDSLLKESDGSNWQPAMSAADLESLLAESRDGYWHFEVSHRLVLERGYECTLCHSARLPFTALNDRPSRLAQTELCTNCH